MSAGYESCSDEALAREAQAGCLPAFEELVYRYEHRLYAFAAQCGAIDPGEVAQETFVRAFQSLKTFDAKRDFAAWLFTIARHRCIDAHRSTRAVPTEALPDSTETGDPAELLAQNEQREMLWALARRQLPETQFQALWLRYAEDMQVAQIAQVLGKTKIHVKVLLFRARQTLARHLESFASAGALESPTPATRIANPKQAPQPCA